MSRGVSNRRALKTYRNIVLLLLAALLIHVGVFPVYGLPYWIHWFFGAIVPGALVVLSVYLIPKRPWQE